VTDESGVLPSLAATVTVTTGVVPWSIVNEGAKEALVEVEICPIAAETPVIQIAESSRNQENLLTTEAGLKLNMPDLRKCQDVYLFFVYDCDQPMWPRTIVQMF
jgi:hypothetical protein